MKKILFLSGMLLLHTFGSYAQPLFRWADGLVGFSVGGGGSQNQVSQLCTDKKGEVYVVGNFISGLDMDPGTGTDSVKCISGATLPGYIGKYDSSGHLIWGYAIGGGGAQACCVDDSGFFYAAGFISGGTDTFGLLTRTDTISAPGLFVAKYDSADHLVWVKTVPGPATNMDIYAIKVDHSGRVYVTGEIDGVIDFDPAHPGTIVFVTHVLDGFVACYDPTGSLVWARQISGGDGDRGTGLDLDPSGNLVLTGYTGGLSTVTWFGDTGSVSRALTTGGSEYDGYVAKYTPAGAVIWLRALAGGGETFGTSVMADSKGNVYATGSYVGWLVPDSAVHDTISCGNNTGGYLVKYTANGGLVWAKNYGCDTGNTHYAATESVAKDDSDNVYLTGYFQTSVKLNPAGAPVTEIGGFRGNGGGMNYYVLKSDSTGNFKWDLHIYNNWDTEPSIIYLDNQNSIYVGGYIADSTNFNPGGTGGAVNYNVGPYNWTPVSFFTKYDQPKPVSHALVRSVPEAAYRVYPNPFGASLVADGLTAGCTIRLYNVMGQVVYAAVTQSAKQVIPTTDLVPGTYFFTLTDLEGYESGRVVVKP